MNKIDKNRPFRELSGFEKTGVILAGAVLTLFVAVIVVIAVGLLRNAVVAVWS